MKWRLECLVIGFLIVAVVAIAQQMFEFGSGQFQQAPATMLASQKQELTVTDGDPVHVIGEAAGTMLVGFNTPEKFLPDVTTNANKASGRRRG